jgi:hypothetical protein
MKMINKYFWMFRTDPLTDDGRFDHEFFASPFYQAEQQSLIKYLQMEGFDVTQAFIIDYRSRRWSINPMLKHI